MIGIVMAGGKGTRMNLENEKLLLEYKKPVILHVIDSLRNSNSFSKIFAVTSNNSPKTKKFLKENNVKTIDTSGIGYVEDLNSVLKTIDDDVLVTSGDLPLLDEEIIQNIITHFDPKKTWTSILISNKFLMSLGLESDFSLDFNDKKCHYTGISMINSKNINSLDTLEENYLVIDDKRIAFNLNSKHDYDLLSTA